MKYPRCYLLAGEYLTFFLPPCFHQPIPNGEVKTIIIPPMLMMEVMMYRVAMYLIQDFFATLCCRKLIPRMAALIKVLVVISKAINS